MTRRLFGWPLAALVLLGMWKHVVSLYLPQHQDDGQVVRRQLGYLPHNFLHVSARTEQGLPIAIKTYPLLRPQSESNILIEPVTHLLNSSVDVAAAARGTPFPTHYWLTCPLIGRVIGDVSI